MGVTCCKEAQTNTILLASTVPSKTHFIQSQWPPNDSQIIDYLKQINKSNQKPLKHISNDYYYLGQWQDTNPSGQGIIYIPNHIIYHGHILEGKPNGNGKVYLINSQSIYDGNFTNGQANGHGSYQSSRQNYTFQGEWERSRPKLGNLKFNNNYTVIQFTDYAKSMVCITYHDGKEYSGQIDSKSLLPNGIGQVQFPDLSSYNGEWFQGKMHGKGIFQWRDPQTSTIIEKYDGNYYLGKKSGYGTFYFQSGNIYEGNWDDGKMNGNGKLTDKNGKEIQKGIWTNGQFSYAVDQNNQIILQKGKQHLNSLQLEYNYNQTIKNNQQQHLYFPTVSPQKNQNNNHHQKIDNKDINNKNNNQSWQQDQNQTLNNHNHKIQLNNIQNKQEKQSKVDKNDHHPKFQ